MRTVRGQPDDRAPGAPGPRQRAPARPAPRRGDVRRATGGARACSARRCRSPRACAGADCAPRRGSSTPAGSSRASRIAPPCTCRWAAGRSSSSGCASPTAGRWPSSGSSRRRRSPRILEGDLEGGSLHDAFERLGRIPTRAQARVSARPATDIERRLLGLDPDGVVLSERRTIDDQDGVADRAHRDAVRRRALRVRGGPPAGRRRGAVVTVAGTWGSTSAAPTSRSPSSRRAASPTDAEAEAEADDAILVPSRVWSPRHPYRRTRNAVRTASRPRSWRPGWRPSRRTVRSRRSASASPGCSTGSRHHHAVPELPRPVGRATRCATALAEGLGMPRRLHQRRPGAHARGGSDGGAGAAPRRSRC